MPGDIFLGPISQTVVLFWKCFRKGCVKAEDIYRGFCNSGMIGLN